MGVKLTALVGWAEMAVCATRCDAQERDRGSGPSPTSSPPSFSPAIPHFDRDARMVTVSAGTAFKIGFFAFFGGLVASFALVIPLLLLAAVFASCIASGIHSRTP